MNRLYSNLSEHGVFAMCVLQYYISQTQIYVFFKLISAIFKLLIQKSHAKLEKKL